VVLFDIRIIKLQLAKLNYPPISSFSFFYDVNPSIKPQMGGVLQKKILLLFSKHFYRGGFNFHDMFVKSTTVDLF
jgi:hypothetical protein